MSLKAIHSIYSFSEAPERESSQNTADTTLKIVKNIQFGNNFTSICLFSFFICESAHCFCPFPYLEAVLSMLPPGVAMRTRMMLYPQSVASGRPRRTPHLFVVVGFFFQFDWDLIYSTTYLLDVHDDLTHMHHEIIATISLVNIHHVNTKEKKINIFSLWWELWGFALLKSLI